MPKPRAIEYASASAAVKAVFDDIKATRNVADVNNFWKYLANDPVTLKRTWESVKEVMGPGTLSAEVKELIYVAVSITNNCGYCVASHGKSAENAGVTPEQFAEMIAIVAMANETNRLAIAYRVPVDPMFDA